MIKTHKAHVCNFELDTSSDMVRLFIEDKYSSVCLTVQDVKELKKFINENVE